MLLIVRLNERCLGFDSMMDEKRYSDLHVLYTLLNRVSEGAYRMCFFLYTYIKVSSFIDNWFIKYLGSWPDFTDYLFDPNWANLYVCRYICSRYGEKFMEFMGEEPVQFCI